MVRSSSPRRAAAHPDVHAIGQPGLTINGGLAQLGGTGGDQIFDLAPVTITSGAFDTDGLSETFATLNLQGTGIGGTGALVNSAAASSTITVTGGTTLTGNTTIGVTQSTGSLTLNNGISGNVALTKVGAGTLLLAGNNTFTGSVAINAGTLALGNAGALGGTSNTVNANSGGDSRSWRAGDRDKYVKHLRNRRGAMVLSINSSANPASFAGTVNVIAPVSIGGSGDITLSGSVDSATNVLTKIGTDTLRLSGSTDNISLAVTVNSGSVILGKASTSGMHAIGGGPGLVINGGRLNSAAPAAIRSMTLPPSRSAAARSTPTAGAKRSRRSISKEPGSERRRDQLGRRLFDAYADGRNHSHRRHHNRRHAEHRQPHAE